MYIIVIVLVFLYYSSLNMTKLSFFLLLGRLILLESEDIELLLTHGRHPYLILVLLLEDIIDKSITFKL